MQKIIDFIKTDKHSFPLFLLLICVLSYGILIPLLGLYWDGWPYMWQYHVFGSAGFPGFVASDRPHSAWVFMLLTWLFGYNILAYHITALVFHWLSGLLIWWSLNIIWPEKRTINALAALLFCIYPGFLQQPISLPYCHHISHMAMFFFSIWGMLYSIRNPHEFWWLTGLSVLSSTVVNFSLEYFTALEFLRPIFIWLAISPKIFGLKSQLVKTFKFWCPYLIALICFSIWRIFIFKFPTYSPILLDQFSSLTVDDSGYFLSKIVRDLYTISFTAWGKVFHFPTISEFGRNATYLFYTLVFSSLLISVIYLIFQKGTGNIKRESGFVPDQSIQFVLIGIFSVLLSGSIYWLLNLPIQVEFAWDRLNLSFAFGVSLLLAGLIEYILRLPWMKILAISFLISLAVGFHFQNTMSFKRDWESFQNFFWQLTWRAPELKPGTVILTTNFPLQYYSDNSLTAPLNWTYDPNSKSNQLQYLLYFTNVRLASQRLLKLQKDVAIQQPYRTFFFKGNTNSALVLKYSPPGCLQILDSIYANAGIIPNLTQLEADEIPLSNITQIITDPENPKVPPQQIISNEPTHDWCYFFEKADLARQVRDWQTVLNLGTEAKTNGLNPRNSSEWLPFLEAYVRFGQWDSVTEIVENSLNAQQNFLPGICYTWERISSDDSISQEIVVKLKSLQAEYNCP